ncbi:hypothetical protein HK104_008158 [Borealophlyctis nickersoniae]|nr:hypothetical protein HK104_008158 [Borealophlyctis nickersoniae]
MSFSTRTAFSRFPRLAPRTLTAVPSRTTSLRFFTHDRLSASELKQKLSDGGQKSVKVDIYTNSEQTQSGAKTSSWMVSTSDLRAALQSDESTGETTQPTFRYSESGNEHHVEVYVESTRSSPVAAEISKRGQNVENEEDNKQYSGDWSAANPEMSKGTGSSQPVNS